MLYEHPSIPDLREHGQLDLAPLANPSPLSPLHEGPWNEWLEGDRRTEGFHSSGTTDGEGFKPSPPLP